METIGQRIKRRREAIGMSADRLAELIDKDRITIYRYENGQIKDMPVTIIEPIARALNTTPAYLMGWETDNLTNNDALDNNEWLLIQNYRALNFDGQKRVKDYIGDLIASGNYVGTKKETGRAS